MKEKVKIGIIGTFLVMLFMPALLALLSVVTGSRIDLPLSGYTEQTKPQKYKFDDWLNGTVQTASTAELTENLMPRGLFIKIYNTINFYLFNKSERVIGKERDIFELNYIDAELALSEENDFSREENVARMGGYMDQIRLLQQLLKDRGKVLYFYVAPSKASVHRDHIPDRFFGISQNHLRAVDVFREKIKETGIPYLLCSDLLDELEYPPFYSTGIHWSRPYEQYASQRIIGDLSRITGKKYRNIVFTGVESSAEPWFRDSDVYDLANVFFRPRVTYYQYNTELEQADRCDSLRVLIQGDSFALGLRKDIIENDETAEVYYVTRDESLVDRNEKFEIFYGDWSAVDWEAYLEHVDVIVLEATEALLHEYSFGFVPMLLNVLQAEE